jgi:hypothetical protein
VWEICERVAEVQALLDDHIADGKHSAADVVAKAQAVLSGSRAAAGDVRCRLIPAEHAADHLECPGFRVSTIAIMASKTLLKL